MLNYRAKVYLALLSSFYELHASLLEKIIILEISLLIRYMTCVFTQLIG
jgi:hypothetical protein